jgi:hypothetical protein
MPETRYAGSKIGGSDVRISRLGLILLALLAIALLDHYGILH